MPRFQLSWPGTVREFLAAFHAKRICSLKQEEFGAKLFQKDQLLAQVPELLACVNKTGSDVPGICFHLFGDLDRGFRYVEFNDILFHISLVVNDFMAFAAGTPR